MKYLCFLMCYLCNFIYEDIFCYVMLFCGVFFDCYNEWWNIIVNLFYIDFGVELCGFCEIDFFLVVLGCELLIVLFLF